MAVCNTEDGQFGVRQLEKNEAFAIGKASYAVAEFTPITPVNPFRAKSSTLR